MVDFSIGGDAGVMAEIRNVVRKKTEVEVLPVVDLSGKSAFQIFFCGRCNTGDWWDFKKNGPDSPVSWVKHGISYGKPVLQTENRSFNTFAGVFDPGNGRLGPAFLEVPPVISGEASSCNGSVG